jgi:MFS family permease
LHGKAIVMTTHQDAADQLKAIRTMMERATIFRALSGEAALVGGAMALAAGWLSEPKTGWAWGSVWLSGLAIALVFGIWQLFRTAAASERTVWSHGLKVALRGALPSLVAGGFLGLLYLKYGGAPRSETSAASVWILHYGLALLAIREFAPKSMTWLGIAFLLTGIASFSAMTFVQTATPILNKLGPSGLMAATFGGFHLLYGAAIVTTSGRDHAGE